ncbi:hypothetical protein Tco_0102928 [Tanacetum coccineum]
MQELAKKQNVADLRLKIQNLKRQISHSNKMMAIESNTKADAMVKSVMIDQGLTENQAFGKVYDEAYRDEKDRIKEMTMNKQLAEVKVFFKTWQVLSIFEMENWSEEKLDFYKKSIGEEAYEDIVNQIGMDCNGEMKDEVAEDRCGSA